MKYLFLNNTMRLIIIWVLLSNCLYSQLKEDIFESKDTIGFRWSEKFSSCDIFLMGATNRFYQGFNNHLFQEVSKHSRLILSVVFNFDLHSHIANKASNK